jgi:hypothetical protein
VGEVLGEMLKANSVLKELDVSSNNVYQGDPAGFAQGISKGLPGNRALTFLNLANNSLAELVLSKGWTTTGDGFFDPIVFKHADGREQKEDPGSKPEGIIAIASAIPDMRALSKLDVGDNSIPPAEKAQLQGTCDAMGVSLVCEDKETTDEGCAQS